MADPGRLDELKRKFDENPRRYFAPLANEYRKAGDAERAIELCRTYLPQQPTHMSGYIVYGQALYDAGRIDESAAVFQQALTLDPENIIALRYLGDIARDKDDRPGAIRWYGKVLELDPRNEEVTNLMADLAAPGQPRRYDGPERPVPPTIRPEPEQQGDALALEELIALPDAPQAEIVLPVESPSVTTVETADESVTIIRWPTDDEDASVGFPTEEPIAGASVESMMDFGLDEPFSVPGATEPGEGGDDDSPIDFAGSPRGGESYGAEDFTGEPIAGGDLLPPAEAEEESPISDESAGPSQEASQAQPGADEEAAGEPSADEGASSTQGVAESTAQPPAGEAAAAAEASAAEATAEDGPPTRPETRQAPAASPFVTETMAELYVAQGMRGEAVAIYRQLLERRDDPRLRARLDELEAGETRDEPAATEAESPSASSPSAIAPTASSPATSGETVRDFFVRIGARRADAAPHISADGESGLSRLFGATALDERDVSAAQSLAGAFTSAADDVTSRPPRGA